MTSEAGAPRTDRGFPPVPGGFIVSAVFALLTIAVFLHAVFPRYEWHTVPEPGKLSIVVYDRWTGRFQRGVYSDDGVLNAMGVFTPF